MSRQIRNVMEPNADHADDKGRHATDLAGLRMKIEAAVRPHMAGPSYALLDFPDYFNPGDCAIWLGERRVLSRLAESAPSLIASIHSYNRHTLKALPGAAPVFLQGGGNFGDLWPHHQLFRERLFADAADRRVVVLTQSIMFRSAQALERARRAIGSHPRLTLLVRDLDSFNFARSHFDCASELCPDFALALDLRRPQGWDPNSVFFLLRGDQESAGIASHLDLGHWRCADWPKPYFLSRSWIHRFAFLPQRVQLRIGDFLSRWRLMKGISVFAGAGSVITDRLHGHVLCTLMGIPNVLLPDAHGKNRGLYETWTRHLPGCGFAETPTQALAELDGLIRA